MMNSSHENIYQAFFAAQKEMGNAKKGSNNPFFKSKYADLNSVREAVMPHLMDQDICVMQPEIVIDGRNYVRTELMHVPSKTSIHSDVEILYKTANDPQAQGSAITYARRYGLQSICGIGAEDDDGNKASGNTTKNDCKSNESKSQAESGKKPDFKPAWINDQGKMGAMFAKIDASGQSPEEKIRGWYLISDPTLKAVIDLYNQHKSKQ